MKPNRKSPKLSITLPSKTLALLDSMALADGTTRSGEIALIVESYRPREAKRGTDG